MKFITVAIAAFYAAGTQAISCNFFADAACQDDANEGTSYACAYETPIASSGSYIQCYAAPGAQESCQVNRCSDSNCTDILYSVIVQPTTNDPTTCLYAGGPGPYYQEIEQASN